MSSYTGLFQVAVEAGLLVGCPKSGNPCEYKFVCKIVGPGVTQSRASVGVSRKNLCASQDGFMEFPASVGREDRS